jgi:hypothetical protein
LSPSTTALPAPSVIVSVPKPPMITLFEPAWISSSSPNAPGPVTIEKTSFATVRLRFASPLSPRTMFELPPVAQISSLPTPPAITFVPPSLLITSRAPVAAEVSVVRTVWTTWSPLRSTSPLSPST